MSRLSLFVTVVVGLFAPLAGGADRATWVERHQLLDQSIRGGLGYADYTDSSTLAWAESYILASYSLMYRATGDTRYLDQVVDHGDRILQGASDADGDGYRGWGTFRYSRDRVINGDFEQQACPFPGWMCPPRLRKLPWHWERWQSSEDTAYRMSDAGRTFVRLKTDPGVGWQVLRSRLPANYTPGARYQVSFLGRMHGTATKGRVDILDATSGQVLAQRLFQGASWGTHVFEFVAPPTPGHALYVRLYHEQWDVSGGQVDVDEVVVKRFAEWLVHDGMITYPLARFAALVRERPVLAGQYGPAADRFVNFIEANILPKWEPEYRPISADAGTYLFPNQPVYGRAGNSLPHNQALALGRTFLHLYRATDNPSHLARAEALARGFKAHLRVEGGAYVWNYSDVMLPGDYEAASGAEDTSHANIEVGFALDLYQQGRVFSHTEVARFAATVRTKMWNGDWARPALTKHVDGSGDDSFSPYLSEWAGLAMLPGQRIHRLADAIYERNGYYQVGNGSHAPTGVIVAAHLALWATTGNGDLEQPHRLDATLPDRFERWQSSPSTAWMEPGNSPAGGMVAVVRTDPSRGWQVLEQPLPSYRPATGYQVRFLARTNGSPAGARLQVLDRTRGTVLAQRVITGSHWRRYTLAFHSPAVESHRLCLRFTHQDWTVAGGEARLDELQVTEQALANASFEAVEPESQGGLPAHWVRWQSDGQSAYLDANARTDGQYGLTIETRPARGWQLVEQRLHEYIPGQTLRLSFQGRTTGASVGGRAEIYDFTEGRSLGEVIFHGGQWQRYQLTWQAPADVGHDVRLRLYHERWDVPGCAAHFDEMALTPVLTPMPAPIIRRP